MRNVNLLEILGEEFPEVKPPPDTAARSWSETEIKKYYREERGGDDSGMCAGDDSKKKTETGPEKATPKPPRRPPASHYPIPTLQTLKTWFPGFERANGFGVEGVLPPGLNTDTNSVHNRKPTARVLCWPNAGNAEDLFTNERSRVGGKLVSTPSALLEWSRLNDTHVFAPQLPGRAARGKENGVPSARAAAKQLLDVIGRIFFFDNLGDDSNADSESSSLDTAVPWVVIGHSLGTWLAFEFCALCEKNGTAGGRLPNPGRLCFADCPPVVTHSQYSTPIDSRLTLFLNNQRVPGSENRLPLRVPFARPGVRQEAVESKLGS